MQFNLVGPQGTFVVNIFQFNEKQGLFTTCLLLIFSVLRLFLL